MASSEQRDLRQTSLEYVLLGETTDRDGNEVDLLVVAELRKRDNFRMQRKNGQKGRSLRPSPKELAGLYRSGSIKFVNDGEKRFREVMEALNVNLDDGSAPITQKATARPAKRVTTKRQQSRPSASKKVVTEPTKSATDDGLQAMTVTQLREMLKDMGGSIYANGKQKNKGALIASIIELRENPQKATSIGDAKDSKATSHRQRTPKGRSSETAATSSEHVDEPKIEEGTTEELLSIADIANLPAEYGEQPDDGIPSLSITDEDVQAETEEATDARPFDVSLTYDPVAEFAEDAATEQTKDKVVTPVEVQSVLPDIASDVSFDIDFGEGGRSESPLAFDFATPVPSDDSVANDPIDATIDDIGFVQEDDSKADVEQESAPIIDVDIPSHAADDDATDDEDFLAMGDIDFDSYDAAELADIFGETPTDDVIEDEPAPSISDSEPEEASEQDAFLPNVSSDDDSDDDEKIQMLDEEAEAQPTSLPMRPTISVPRRQNRRLVPRRRQPAATGIDQLSTSPIFSEKINLGDGDTQPQTTDTKDPMEPEASDNNGVLDFSALSLDFLQDDSQDEPVAEATEEEVQEESQDANDYQADDGMAVAIQDDEDEIINIFDDLDNEGIHTSDDLIEALYDGNEVEQADEDAQQTPSYSNFEFAWSNKVRNEDVPISDQQADEETSYPYTDEGLYDWPQSSSEQPEQYQSNIGTAEEDAPSTDALLQGFMFDGDKTQGVEYDLDSHEDASLAGLADMDSDMPEPVEYELPDQTADDTAMVGEYAIAPTDGYPMSQGTNRGLDQNDRILIRKTFKRMMFEVLVIAAIAIIGIIFLVMSGVPVFPSIMP